MTTQEKILIFYAYNTAMVKWRSDIHPCADFINIKNLHNEGALLLTDLSQITDEHKKELSMLIYCIHCGLKNTWVFGWNELMGLYVYQILLNKEHSKITYVPSSAIDTLRKWGYNAGYGKYAPQDLIDEGVVNYSN